MYEFYLCAFYTGYSQHLAIIVQISAKSIDKQRGACSLYIDMLSTEKASHVLRSCALYILLHHQLFLHLRVEESHISGIQPFTMLFVYVLCEIYIIISIYYKTHHVKHSYLSISCQILFITG